MDNLEKINIIDSQIDQINKSIFVIEQSLDDPNLQDGPGKIPRKQTLQDLYNERNILQKEKNSLL